MDRHRLYVSTFESVDQLEHTIISNRFQYRDFTNDPNTFPYEEGQELIARLATMGQHYIPIVDSAIYIPSTYTETSKA